MPFPTPVAPPPFPLPSRWWEVFETVRKLYVGAVAVFVYSASASQLMVSQLVMLAVLILVLQAQPYARPSDNW